MLAVPWDRPFDDDDWLFEPKLDGIRGLATIAGGSVRIRSRAGNDLTDSYRELAALAELDGETILDGEIIAYDEAGVPSFEHLQASSHRVGGSAVAISYVVFDVLALRGEPTVGLPLDERLELLSALALPSPAVTSTVVRREGVALYDAAAERGLEGVMAKRIDSTYRPGERSPLWRKIPHILRTRAIVGGFTESSGAGAFGALLLGMWDDGELRYVGSVGTGFDHASADAIRQALDQMTAAASAFAHDPAIPAATFVHPHLVAEIAFKQWTKAGRLRAPSFKGFSDRDHESITWGAEGPV